MIFVQSDSYLKQMQEPEVSLRVAMKYIQENRTCRDVTVCLDGAHIKTGNAIHFDIERFMDNCGYIKCSGKVNSWQGVYKISDHLPGIVLISKPGIGDVVIHLNDGTTLYVESKKIKGGASGEYPAMREAIGQLMTGCPDDSNVIPVVAIPYTPKSYELAQKWASNHRICNAGIRFMLVHCNGNVTYVY